jgi:glycosyltransferase involved in cell wall biosynthesis
MATALPVVAPDIDRLRAIARPGLEGVLYDASDSNGLANAIEALSDPSTRTRLGTSARERVVERFGWDTHCQTLAAAFERALRQRRGH